MLAGDRLWRGYLPPAPGGQRSMALPRSPSSGAAGADASRGSGGILLVDVRLQRWPYEMPIFSSCRQASKEVSNRVTAVDTYHMDGCLACSAQHNAWSTTQMGIPLTTCCLLPWVFLLTWVFFSWSRLWWLPTYQQLSMWFQLVRVNSRIQLYKLLPLLGGDKSYHLRPPSSVRHQLRGSSGSKSAKVKNAKRASS